MVNFVTGVELTSWCLLRPWFTQKAGLACGLCINWKWSRVAVYFVWIYIANFLSLCRLLRSFVGYTVHRTLTLFYVFNKQDNASNKQENLKRVGKYVDSVFIFSYLYKTIGPDGSIPSPCYLCPLANLLLYCHYF